MAKHNLSRFGIAVPVELDGDVNVLRQVGGVPVVFLIDEHHTTPECIAQNIQNAQNILSGCPSILVGVESHAALHDPTNSQPVSTCPEFANAMVLANASVIGVEDTTLYDKIIIDIADGKWASENMTNHPNNTARSRSFIRTLATEFQERQLNGGMMLNAGRKHIDDIAVLIEAGTIDELTTQQFSYVRIRPSAYPAG
jgi:hypothetical protein